MTEFNSVPDGEEAECMQQKNFEQIRNKVLERPCRYNAIEVTEQQKNDPFFQAMSREFYRQHKRQQRSSLTAAWEDGSKWIMSLVRLGYEALVGGLNYLCEIVLGIFRRMKSGEENMALIGVENDNHTKMSNHNKPRYD